MLFVKIQNYSSSIKFEIKKIVVLNSCFFSQGAVAGENTQEASDRISVLQDEINRLDQHEKMLDQHKTVSSINIHFSYQI